MNKEEFLLETKKLDINISVDNLKKLEEYYNLLVEENKKYNLTAITEEKQVYLKHFYDSLCLTKIIKLDNQHILDIGTGAGFPGLVLKIVFPNIKIDLLDSTNKRCLFLQMVIDKLNLKDVNVINARAEEFAKENREKYDIVTSRAVAPLKHLLEYSIPLVKVNGTYVAMKSDITKELDGIEVYEKKLNIKQENLIKFNLPLENSLRTLISYKKLKETDSIYPRRYSEIKKKSL